MIRTLLAAAASLALCAAAPDATAAAFDGLYSVQAKGVTAGDFAFKANLTEAGYSATTSRRSTGMVRGLVGSRQDYDYSAQGRIADGEVKPAAYRHSGGRRNRVVDVAFRADGSSVTTANPVMGMGDPPATEAQRRGAIDQVSALVSILATPQGQDPCRRNIPILMDGRARFDFVMSPNGTQSVRTAAFTGEAIRCRVEFRPIAGFGDPVEPETLTFLLARVNGLMVPVRIQMPTDGLGTVTLEARRLSVTP